MISEKTKQAARDVLGFHGRKGGWEPGGFTSALLSAIGKADQDNKALLALGFPEHVWAMVLSQESPNGVAQLQRILGVEE